MWLTLLFTGTAGLFTLWTVSTLWHLRWVRRLPRPSPFARGELAEPLPPRARCSVIVAARNEQNRIEQAILRALGQKGVEVELIVVDDRSTDRTAEILQGVAASHPQLKAIRVDMLPEGWLGKCHACYVGASAATSDWILFTDADCWLKDDALACALQVAERDRVDHVTMTSGLACGSLGLEASHLLFLISLSNWFSGVNRFRPRAYLGIGAFNLVRTAAYRECGGYEALRLTVLDDVKLGLLLCRAGKRTRAFIGADDVQCYWGTTAWSTVKIMEKNYFAALDYRLGLALAGGLFAVLVFAVLLFGLLSGTVAGLSAAISPLSLIVPATVLARRSGLRTLSAVYVPFMLPLFFYAVLNSTFVTLRNGGIRWRDTFYPLRTLRLGNVRSGDSRPRPTQAAEKNQNSCWST